MDMKKLIQQMTDIENSAKKTTLNEAASLTISAETGAEIADMIKALQNNAGMQSKPVGGDMPMPMRTDIDKFRAAVADDPKIPGRDDVEGDQDLQAGVVGAGAGAGLGAMLGGPLGAIAGGALGQELTDKDYDNPDIPGRDDVEGDQDLQAGVVGDLIGGALGGLAGDAAGAMSGVTDKLGQMGANLGSRAGSAIANKAADLAPDTLRRLAGNPQVMGIDVPDALIQRGAGAKGAELGQKAGSAIGKALPAAGGAIAGGAIANKLTKNKDKEAVPAEGYANEPDEKYDDHGKMTHDLSGGINRPKKAYKAAQPGDNAMAVEGAPDLSPKFIKHLQVTFGDKEMLSRSETRKVEDMLNKLSIENIKTLVGANIPHVSDMAKEYMRNNTPGGMKNYDEDMIEAIKAQLMAALEEKKAKPDYIDIDGDGDKEEPMKKAVKDKKAKKTTEAGLKFPREDIAQAYKIYADALKKDMLGAEAEDLVAYFAVKKLAYEPEDAEMLAQRAAVMHIDRVGEMQGEGIISTVKKAYQDAKKEKEKNDYYNKLAGDALKRMEPKELKPYYDAMRDKKKKK